MIVVEGFAKNRTCIIVDTTKNNELSREENRLAMDQENYRNTPIMEIIAPTTIFFIF
jgi:hypothetical protein